MYQALVVVQKCSSKSCESQLFIFPNYQPDILHMCDTLT